MGVTEIALGASDRTEGKFEAADERYRAGLSTFRQLDSLLGTAWALYAFADLAFVRGRHHRALRLVGATDAPSERIGGQIAVFQVAVMGDVGAAARSVLGEITAEGHYEEGRAMEVEDAMALALKWKLTSPRIRAAAGFADLEVLPIDDFWRFYRLQAAWGERKREDGS